MEIDNQRLLYLLDEYSQNRISPGNLEELLAYLHQPGTDPHLLKAMEEIGNRIGTTDAFDDEKEHIYQQIVSHPVFLSGRTTFSRKVFNLKYLSIAAALILCLGASLYFLPFQSKPQTSKIAKSDLRIDMGSNTAILTLANGQKVSLNTNQKGTIAKQGIYNIKQNGGSLQYEPIQQDTSAKIAYNTITTPKGSAYQLILGDGTKVWMNANSSLTFPVSFSGKTREVSIMGEAYFEVVHNSNQPFTVSSNGVNITDLGTHFNVKAYPREKMTTTLLSGSIKISKNNTSEIIKPDQAADIWTTKNRIEIKDVDADESVSWKNGYFVFENENIKDVMNTIMHWYDIDVEYQGDMSNKTFGGTITRFRDINKLLNSIELTGALHFKTEGRRVIVMN